MKKVLLMALCVLFTGMQMPIVCQDDTSQTVSNEDMLSPENRARLNKIRVFNIPGMSKRLFVDTEQLTRYINLCWSAVLFNHKPKNDVNTKAAFYAVSALTALANLISRGYGSALYVAGASWGTEFLNTTGNEETCKTHLLRGLMTSQFVQGLYELDKIVANPFGLRVIWIR